MNVFSYFWVEWISETKRDWAIFWVRMPLLSLWIQFVGYIQCTHQSLVLSCQITSNCQHILSKDPFEDYGSLHGLVSFSVTQMLYVSNENVLSHETDDFHYVICYRSIQHQASSIVVCKMPNEEICRPRWFLYVNIIYVNVQLYIKRDDHRVEEVCTQFCLLSSMKLHTSGWKM